MKSMPPQPHLRSDRLLLRPFLLSDAPHVQELAGDAAIAAVALDIPHPFEDGMAEAWITECEQAYTQGLAANFAIVLPSENLLIGAVGAAIQAKDVRGELGYWIGKPYWGHGYASEATQAFVQYAFESLELNRLYATCLRRNTASANVLQKLGMKQEGCLLQHVYHRGNFEDLDEYGLLKQDWVQQCSD